MSDLSDTDLSRSVEPGAAELVAEEADALLPDDLDDDAAVVVEGVPRRLGDVLAALAEGTLIGATLSTRARRHVVDRLESEGWDTPEMARRLGVAERTIRRDRERLRAERAVTPSLTLTHQVLGEFYRLTMLSVQRLTRLAMDSRTPPYARLWAEDTLGRAYARFVDAARRLEHLAPPRTPQPSPAASDVGPPPPQRQDEGPLPPSVRQLNALLSDMRSLDQIGARLRAMDCGLRGYDPTRPPSGGPPPS